MVSLLSFLIKWTKLEDKQRHNTESPKGTIPGEQLVITTSSGRETRINHEEQSVLYTRGVRK